MDKAKKALKPAAFNLSDMAQGEDGKLYHLPTLRTLHTAGRLSRDSVGYVVLMQRVLHTARLIA